MYERLKIFLSSTQTDLAEARENIIKFLGIVNSEVLAMEVFGSDESKPVDFCLEQVRKSDIFIGVYAERYGSIDSNSGKSLTELEYLEAQKMLREGTLRALLVYIVDPKTSWQLDLVERNPSRMAQLLALKEKILSEHTVSFFRRSEDLPYLILRDVIKRIGVGLSGLFRAKEHKRIKLAMSLDRPVGMEYYGEDLTMQFFGRGIESELLEKQILSYKMSLLIGVSGVGKTSLIHANLIHRVKEMGWHTALIRPLAEPVENLRRFLWDQLLEGHLPIEFDFASVLNAAATAYKGRQVLIVIDQFEDILLAKDSSDVAVLTTNLYNFFNTYNDNIRILICYRGDVEPQIGTIWQKISGSPQGLPRTYLGPLTRTNAKRVIEGTLSALGVCIQGEQPVVWGRTKVSIMNCAHCF